MAIKNNNDENELLYRFRDIFWGQGYGTELAWGLINYGFETMDFELITADASTDNTGSIKILEKFLKFDQRIFSPNGTDLRFKLDRQSFYRAKK